MSILPLQLSGKFDGSFAYKSLKIRLPNILIKFGDTLIPPTDASELLSSHFQSLQEEVKTLEESLRNDGYIEFFTYKEAEEDNVFWTQAISERLSAVDQLKPTFFSCPWLFSECYVYRRLQNSVDNFLGKFDIFRKAKEDAMQKSFDTSVSLLRKLHSLNVANLADDQKNENFIFFLKVCLWGNAFDLSISTGNVQSQSLDPDVFIQQLESNILCDESMKLHNLALSVSKKGSRLDLICDNAGLELVSDICLTLYVIKAGYFENVHLHLKNIPWFVSDATLEDFGFVMNYLSRSNDYRLNVILTELRSLIAKNIVHLDTHTFWTSPYEYARMGEVAPDLYEELSKSDLLIFKGDLNYRKLISDLQWPCDSSFQEALRGFRPSPLCALRVLKCDISPGISSQDVARAKTKRDDWMTCGDFAVIQVAA